MAGLSELWSRSEILELLAMNQIIVWEPRWHDRVVLVANHKLQEHNEIVIKYKTYPNPFYISGTVARSFPLEQLKTKAGTTMAVRAIPLVELEKEVINV